MALVAGYQQFKSRLLSTIKERPKAKALEKIKYTQMSVSECQGGGEIRRRDALFPKWRNMIRSSTALVV